MKPQTLSEPQSFLAKGLEIRHEKINACRIHKIFTACVYRLHRSAIHGIVQPMHDFA